MIIRVAEMVPKKKNLVNFMPITNPIAERTRKSFLYLSFVVSFQLTDCKRYMIDFGI